MRIWNQAARRKNGTGQRKTRADFQALASEAQLAIAERNGKPVGAVCLADSGSPDGVAAPGELEVTHLAVATVASGQGIERVLLSWVHGEASRRGVQRLVVWIPRDQVETREIFRSLAYARLPGREKRNGGRPGFFYVLPLRKRRRSLAAIRSGT